MQNREMYFDKLEGEVVVKLAGPFHGGELDVMRQEDFVFDGGRVERVKLADLEPLETGFVALVEEGRPGNTSILEVRVKREKYLVTLYNPDATRRGVWTPGRVFETRAEAIADGIERTRGIRNRLARDAALWGDVLRGLEREARAEGA